MDDFDAYTTHKYEPYKAPQVPAQQQEPKPKFVRNVDGVPCITLVEHEHLMRSRPQPSKPWAGLTDEEFASMWMRSEIYGTNREKAIALGRAVEAKLKEKNHG